MNTDDIKAIIERIASKQYTEEDITLLQQQLTDNPQIASQLGKNIVNIGEGKEIHIGDIYLELNGVPTLQTQKCLDETDLKNLIKQVRPICCEKIENLYSEMFLWRNKTCSIEQFYVDVYVLGELSNERFIDQTKAISKLTGNDAKKNFQRLGLGERQENNRKNGIEVLVKGESRKRWMILGKPGAGKSTFLRYLAAACCKKLFQPELIPVLIQLRDITKDDFDYLSQPKDYTQTDELPKLLNLIYKKFFQGLNKIDLPKIENILQEGKLLILLDGLDEVPIDWRKKLNEEILSFCSTYFKNTIIITCRTQANFSRESFARTQFNYLEIADFNEKQVEKYTENWFEYVYENADDRQEIKISFLEKIQDSNYKQIAELAVTPILLNLTCLVFSQRKNLPQKFYHLYDDGINLLLEDWDKDTRSLVQKDNPQLKTKLEHLEINSSYIEAQKKLLSYIAAHKFIEEQYALFTKEDICKYIRKFLKEYDKDTKDGEILEFIKYMETQHGLFIERAENVYSFSHLTFQEYFTAKYAINNIELLKEYLIDDRWREVFLLAAELMGNDAEKLLFFMQQTSQKYINNNYSLKVLLNWANQVTKGANQELKPIGKRAVALMIANAIAYAYANMYDYSTTNSIIAANLNSDGYDNVKAIANANGIIYRKAMTYGDPDYDTVEPIYSNIIQEILDAIDRPTEPPIFNDQIKLKQLLKTLGELRELEYDSQQFYQNLIQALLGTFNLTEGMINLSTEEIEILDKKYCRANLFIIECKKAAIGDDSPSWWEKIEERMLKVE
jgi:predicted NACHT family NTPase